MKNQRQTAMTDADDRVEKDSHYLGHRRRLRERFEKNGLDGFADYEVIELLLMLREFSS